MSSRHCNGGSEGCGIVFWGEAIADCKTPRNGGVKVALGCRLWRGVIGTCNSRLLNAARRWHEAGAVLEVVVPFWEMQLQIR